MALQDVHERRILGRDLSHASNITRRTTAATANLLLEARVRLHQEVQVVRGGEGVDGALCTSGHEHPAPHRKPSRPAPRQQ
jgi:hypothetical protein